MIIHMRVGLEKNSPEVEAVINKASAWQVNPEIELIEGTKYSTVSIRLYDGKNRSNIIPEHVFNVLDGVEDVMRVTPPEISLAYNGQDDAKTIVLGPDISVGNYLPCRIIFGPCTVDRHVDEIVESIASHGIKMIRGGCWKPRSSPYSFPGHGEKAVRWLLSAAAKHGIESVFLEVMESDHIRIVEKIQNEVGFNGSIVLWVGARTKNSILLRELGKQKKYPVMLKHALSDETPERFTGVSEWIVNGPVLFDDDGNLLEKESSESGNHDLMLCLRGSDGGVKPWRFRPNWEWTEYIRKNWWTPVIIDPSHAAGTMQEDLVFTAINSALIHKPAALLVEGGYPEDGFPDKKGYRGLCDMDQSIPIERLPELIEIVRKHNKKHYGIDTF